jgi:hypothetical protein
MAEISRRSCRPRCQPRMKSTLPVSITGIPDRPCCKPSIRPSPRFGRVGLSVEPPRFPSGRSLPPRRQPSPGVRLTTLSPGCRDLVKCQ